MAPRDIRLIIYQPLEPYIYSPTSTYRPNRFIFSDYGRTNALVAITENTTNGTLGNNDGLEFTGDAIVNFVILNLIMKHLHTVKAQLGYDDSKLYACAAFLHGRLKSNHILGLIYYKQIHGDIDTLSIGTQQRCRTWEASKFQGKTPKVLADLFEANAWLIYKHAGLASLSDHMASIFSPLFPMALGSFDHAYRNTHTWDSNGYGPSDCFLYRICDYEANDAKEVALIHTQRLLQRLADWDTSALEPMLYSLTHSLRRHHPVRYDTEHGRISGIHLHFQLQGYTALHFYLADAHDRLFPIHRSAVRKAASFQTQLLRLATSDATLEHLYHRLQMDIPSSKPNLSSREAGQVFTAAVASFQSQDQVSFDLVMRLLSVHLVKIAVATLRDFGIKLDCAVPAGPGIVNTLPCGDMLGRPVVQLRPPMKPIKLKATLKAHQQRKASAKAAIEKQRISLRCQALVVQRSVKPTKSRTAAASPPNDLPIQTSTSSVPRSDVTFTQPLPSAI